MVRRRYDLVYGIDEDGMNYVGKGFIKERVEVKVIVLLEEGMVD